MRSLKIMRLYHSTDEACKQGIEKYGFYDSKVMDSRGFVWFCDGKDPDVPTMRTGWWISIDLSDEIAAEYLYRLLDGQVYGTSPICYYRVPLDLTNSRKPFLFERWS